MSCKIKGISVGDTLTMNNYGDLVVDRIDSAESIFVTFVSTGYKCKVRASRLRAGTVKDRMMPYVYGVGFFGDGDYKIAAPIKSNKESNSAYRVWDGMMMRCYSESHHKRYPAYRGVKVCNEWHNFQNFAEWFYANRIDGYQMDKDLKGNDAERVYSPGTCTFLSPQENTEVSQAKCFSFISPCGDLVRGVNLSRFCKENNLDQPAMHRVLRSKAEHHKGWRKYEAIR